MARALKPEESEVFKDAIFPERRFVLNGGYAEEFAAAAEDETDPTLDSDFWLSDRFPTTNS